jgi:hypothetical protein
MSINWVTGDGWWRVFRFAALAHACARKGDNSKYLSQPVTRHPIRPAHFLLNGGLQRFSRLKGQARCRKAENGAGGLL